MTIQGFVHLHRQSGGSVRRLVELHRSRSYDFLCVTDHPDELTAAEFRAARQVAASSSGRDFCCVYGLEGPTKSGAHIMGIGIERYIELGSLSLKEAMLAVRQNGGIAVLAHPDSTQLRQAIVDGAVPDGVEVWNALRSGWAPDPRLLSILREAGPPWSELPRFGGPDAHRGGHLFKVETRLEGATLDRSGILGALREGRFRIRRGLVELRATGTQPAPSNAPIWALSRSYLRFLRWGRRRLSGSEDSHLPSWLVRLLERTT